MIETEDDWFYESISRYKNLNMFELEYPVYNLELTTNKSICVSSSNKKRHQLLELTLPSKLLVAEKDFTEITNDTDLKIRCGTFTPSKIAHMKASKVDRSVFASHVDKQGVSLYGLSTDDSDQLQEKYNMPCELKGPCMDLNDAVLVLAKDTASPVCVMDIKTRETIGRVQFAKEAASSPEAVTPLFLGAEVVALCHHSSGRVQLYDKRNSEIQSGIGCEKRQGWDSYWAFSKYETEQTSPQSCLATLSNNGTFKMYDSRSLNTPVFNGNLGIKTTSNVSVDLKLKLTDEKWLSVSGFDGNVYIYKVTSEPELIFVHDGHKHVEGHSSHTTTTAHVWYPNIDNLLISSANNGTVQLWQFEDKKEVDS